MSAPLAAAAACVRPECGHSEDLHDGICFGTACECVRFVAAEVFVPRTERSYWVDIAAALNAAHAAGMPVGVDLDGTLTDHNAWSVVWDRVAERWAVAGYEDEDTAPGPDAVSRVFSPVASLREPGGEFDAYLRHPYRTGHDLPETGGAK